MSQLCMRWPKYWSFSFNIIPSKEIPGPISFRMDWLDLLAVQGTLKSLFPNHSSKASILQCSTFFVIQLLATPWTAAHQASLSITNTQSLLKLISIESVRPANHLILCHPLLLLPSILPSLRVFPNESVLLIRWSKYWSFSISPSNEYSGLIYSHLSSLL